jgi:Smg protein
MNDNMLEVLVHLFKNYVSNSLDFLVNMDTLTIELQQAGFALNQIDKAFQWLNVIIKPENLSSTDLSRSKGMRIFHDLETKKLSLECRSLIYFLEYSGLLNSETRELIIDRAMALDSYIVEIEQLKWVIMLVMINNDVQQAVMKWVAQHGSVREI